MTETSVRYDDAIARKFLWATIIWGLVGMVVGLLIAVQLFYFQANFNIPWLTFGRLRPLHTNAVIFAFCGNAIFAGIYHSSQRLLKARMFSDILSNIHFWGWQTIIVGAALTLPFGFTQSKEYAELEWPIDIAIALVWVVFAINFFMTVKRRAEKILYVSIWFYMATVITITVLHVVNSLAFPVTPLKSYSMYSGVQDALVQWWYGHNAVAFFLTTPFLGLGYYYIPKAIQRPIYSYRLSIIHFWSLVFLYIWAGPHHLQYTALPEWLQSLGMVFSVMLIAPSWGGGVNFILTMRNGWEKVKTDPILKFFVAATTFYMMATFEGPLLSIKSVNKISHYTDWTVAHVHAGALGWNGLLVFGMAYWLMPRLYKTKLYSEKLANTHFWLALAGIVLYIVPMWTAGAVHGVMAGSLEPSGALVHPNFLEIVTAIIPLHVTRALGGSLFIAGLLLLIYNLIKTVQSAPADLEDFTLAKVTPIDWQAVQNEKKDTRTAIETIGQLMGVLVFVSIMVGTIIEMIPMFAMEQSAVAIASVKPYSPLQLEGRDIYIREGCNNCHSQMVRPLLHETKRYGQPSQAGEFVYDHPHLWGSKRTGPDLHRVGKKYGDQWHWKHMIDPRSISPGSTMPSYDWLAADDLDTKNTKEKMRVLKVLGVPYTTDEIEKADESLTAESKSLADNLKSQGENPKQNSELIALIAYLQRLGTDIKNTPSISSTKGTN